MSDTDSFIEEVSEEVRKDKLFAMAKRWGWVAGLAVFVLVGGAAYNEWRKASERNLAQGFGDQLLAAIDSENPAATLADVTAEEPGQVAVAGHLAAAAALAADDNEAGQQALSEIQNNSEIAPIYRDLAAFKAALALPEDVGPEERKAAFDAISAPGAPFRVLAQEQKALVMIKFGETDEAIALLRQLLDDAEVTPGLQRRASELMVALGADLDAETSDG